jgi:hypothetical protein
VLVSQVGEEFIPVDERFLDLVSRSLLVLGDSFFPLLFFLSLLFVKVPLDFVGVFHSAALVILCVFLEELVNPSLWQVKRINFQVVDQ